MTTIPDTAAIYNALEQVMDPEIPVLNVLELGMITGVVLDNGTAHIKMIPTFAACPAVSVIQQNIRAAVHKLTGLPVQVSIDNDVQWNSNRLTETAKKKLQEFGIAAPQTHTGRPPAEIMLNTPCPHCHSENTYLRSPFGSTLCRAIHYCKDCGMVFEQFKPVE